MHGGSGESAGQPLSAAEPTQAEYCAGHGSPVVALPAAASAARAGARCASSVAATVFAHGLCSCKEAVFTGEFSIDAIDSGAAGSGVPGAAASVGINGQLIATGGLDIGGSLIAAGREALSITSGGFNIDGNFQTNADLFLTGTNIRFGRDLWVNGLISAVGISRVEGNVYQPPGELLAGMSVGGRSIQRDFEVPEPCACGEGQVLDIDAIVAEGSALAAAAPAAPLGGKLELECGRFAARDLHVTGTSVLKAHGRSALFVTGDLTLTGAIGTDLGTEGELDIFITGNLFLTGENGIGMRERPSALRFYVGGGGAIAITGASHFAANLYRPGVIPPPAGNDPAVKISATGVPPPWALSCLRRRPRHSPAHERRLVHASERLVHSGGLD